MNTKSVRRLDAQGRVILPSHIRKALDLGESSQVEITLNEDSSVTIRPAVKRCCVCGMPVATKRSYMTIAAKVCGESYVCSECVKIIEKLEEGE